MQDEKMYKNGIKSYLMLVAAVREIARRNTHAHAAEVDGITRAALEECIREAEKWSDDYLNLMIERATITADILEKMIDNHIVERMHAIEEAGGTDGNYS